MCCCYWCAWPLIQIQPQYVICVKQLLCLLRFLSFCAWCFLNFPSAPEFTLKASHPVGKKIIPNQILNSLYSSRFRCLIPDIRIFSNDIFKTFFGMQREPVRLYPGPKIPIIRSHYEYDITRLSNFHPWDSIQWILYFIYLFLGWYFIICIIIM